MCDKMRRVNNFGITEHDMHIFLRYLNGVKPSEIAIDEHISRQRVYNIIAKVRLFRGEEVYKDPYDLRYLQSITPRTRKFLIKRGAKDIKELSVWVKNNRLTTIPGVGETIERKILIQLNDFMRWRRIEEQYKKTESESKIGFCKCDICGNVYNKDEDENKNYYKDGDTITGNRNYNITGPDDELLKTVPEMMNMDVCPKCFERFCNWIKIVREETK